MPMSTEHKVSQNGQVYLTPREAAAYLEISRTTLWRYVSYHRLPAIRVTPRKVLFDRRDIDRWLRKRREVRR